MTLLYSSPAFLEHDTGDHPENATRLEHITALLDSAGLAAKCTQPAWSPAPETQLAVVHTHAHISAIKGLSLRGGGWIDSDTFVSPRSFDAAALAAGAACDAVSRVIKGEDSTALCLVRPPGHHALTNRAMGFCLFGNVAIAARWAIEQLSLDRILVVDWDVHHGNGTQAMFYEDSRVGFFSIHRWPFYPGTGDVDETGRGDGLGATRNLPTEFGTSRREYLTRFGDELADFAARMQPQLVLISAGFDAHAADPIGSLGLEIEDFEELTRIVLAVGRSYAAGRVVSVLEGGYNPAVLAQCVGAHLALLLHNR